MNIITTPAGRPLTTSTSSKIRKAMIEARPHLREALAAGGRIAYNAEHALALMVTYEICARNDDEGGIACYASEFESFVERIGYNPMSPNGK